MLRQHVDEDGFVNYEGFLQDSDELEDYLVILSEGVPDKDWTDEEKLAFWINTYNAFTIKLILDHYPVTSIKKIKWGIPFINSVFDIQFFKIGGISYDLNKIEHGILRKQFDEPRIHFAINCASISCPPLKNEAYVAERLDKQLTEAAETFLADKMRNKISGDVVEISKIFSWFRRDFVSDEQTFIQFLNQYSPTVISEKADIRYLKYDWNLNDFRYR